ncbi:DNA polymerase III [Cutibacterium acnes JCM 18909]|nr:DNA polymerase III [Cutibacterium acnes JCM 18909]
MLARGEVRNYKLSTLSRLFHTTTTPSHRALADARATVDVLHGLIDRVGNLGVTTLEDLLEMTHRVPQARRRRRAWAKDLPKGPESIGFAWINLHQHIRRSSMSVSRSTSDAEYPNTSQHRKHDATWTRWCE